MSTAMEAAFTAAEASGKRRTKPPADREAARARRQEEAAKKRARAKIAQAEFERLARIKAEEIAENQAPGIQRAAIVGVTPEMLRSAKAAKLYGPVAPIVLREPLATPDGKWGGYRRADPLERMHARDPRMVTRLHLAAARKFSEDYECGACGATASGGLKEFVNGSGISDVSENRLEALERYMAACEAMGPTLRSPVQMCVLHKHTLATMAPVFGMSEERISGWLLGGLDRLCDHYWPNRVTRAEEAERTLTVDPAVTDIPQERLGRRKQLA